MSPSCFRVQAPLTSRFGHTPRRMRELTPAQLKTLGRLSCQQRRAARLGLFSPSTCADQGPFEYNVNCSAREGLERVLPWAESTKSACATQQSVFPYGGGRNQKRAITRPRQTYRRIQADEFAVFERSEQTSSEAVNSTRS